MQSALLAQGISGLGYTMLGVLAIALACCLLAGTATAAVLFAVTRRHWVWLTIPLFAGLWFGLGLLAMIVIRSI